MANYKIIPYRRIHGDYIVALGMNSELMDDDNSNKENRIDFEIPTMAFTLLADDKPIVSGGVFPLWFGVAEGWVLASKNIFEHKIKAASLIKRRTDLICQNNNIYRLQTTVKENFDMGLRFAKFLGFKNEGLMEKYGPNQTNYFRMAKIY